MKNVLHIVCNIIDYIVYLSTYIDRWMDRWIDRDIYVHVLICNVVYNTNFTFCLPPEHNCCADILVFIPQQLQNICTCCLA